MVPSPPSLDMTPLQTHHHVAVLFNVTGRAAVGLTLEPVRGGGRGVLTQGCIRRGAPPLWRWTLSCPSSLHVLDMITGASA